MTPATKLNVFVGFPSYGGNGGISSEVPDIREWWTETVLKMKADPRVGEVFTKTIADTPITMVRNKFVTMAKQHGCHLLMMVDSDQSPNKHARERWFKPFWDEAFNFIYERYARGPNLVFAPYCGPPSGGENVYVFQWRDYGNHGEDTSFSLESYSREQAAIMSGIQEAAAGPTGLILIDMRLCDMIAPVAIPKRSVLEQVQAGAMSVADALMNLREGAFYYEWKDCRADQKASTEDVTFTRDVSLVGQELLGYNPVHCAWDSWIGHYKPWNVGRPQRYTTEQVGVTLRKAVLENTQPNELILDMSALNTGNSPVEKELRRLAENAHNSNGHSERNPNGAPLTLNTSGVKEFDTGAWRDHGHAHPHHQAILCDLLRSIAYKKNRQLRVLEVGSWLGSTAIQMADCLNDPEVHCVDTWDGSPTDLTGILAKEAGGPGAVWREFLRNIGDRRDVSIFPHRGTSEHLANEEWEPFDFIFIDAEHTYEACKSDILSWWPNLADDGIMVGHDFQVKGHRGVVQAVEELFGEDFETCGWHPQGGMWLVRKQNFPEGLHNGLSEASAR